MRNTTNFGEIHKVVANKQGSSLLIALIYLHLAAYLNLPLYLIQLQGFQIIKWVQGKRSKYINLANHGKLIDEKQILDALHKTVDKTKEHESLNTQLEIIPTKNLLLHYVQSLSEIYKNEKKEFEHKAMLDVSLIISPSNLNFLSQRALLLKKMGHHKEALLDLKKYFSFTCLDNSPEEIKIAFYELKSTDIHSSPINWLRQP